MPLDGPYLRLQPVLYPPILRVQGVALSRSEEPLKAVVFPFPGKVNLLV